MISDLLRKFAISGSVLFLVSWAIVISCNPTSTHNFEIQNQVDGNYVIIWRMYCVSYWKRLKFVTQYLTDFRLWNVQSFRRKFLNYITQVIQCSLSNDGNLPHIYFHTNLAINNTCKRRGRRIYFSTHSPL